MSFNFDELLSKGSDAANLVTQNNQEIDDVFKNLETSLSNFLGFDVTFREEIQYENSRFEKGLTSSIFEPRKKTGYNNVLIKNEQYDLLKKIMSIKRSNDGYPIVIVHETNHYTADNVTELAEAIGFVISNAQTHLILRQLIKTVAEKTE